MKREKISDIVEKIDQKYIDEASGVTRVTEAVRRGRLFRRWGVVAACFVLAVAIGVGAWTIGGNTPGVEIKDPPDSADVSPNLENSDAVTSKPKEYTSFEAEAFYETMLTEGEPELEGVVYKPTAPLKFVVDIPENIKKTVTKTIFGIEQEYKLTTVFENEALDLKICQYVSSQGQIIKINATTGSLMGYSDTKSTIGKPGKRRANDEELIEKAIEYLDEFIDEDITQYSAELTRETDYSNYVCFALKKNGKTVYRAYHIYLDYGGEFWNYLANDSIEYKEIKELSEDALKQAEEAAETAMMDVCEKNGISFSETSKINASMYYSAEDSCPVINFAYTVPVSVDGETKERTIVVQVKAK